MLQPCVELRSWHRDNLEPHIRMRHTAELSALAEELARRIRLEPHLVVVIRYHIDLAREFGHPEAMDNIHGIQEEYHGFADRDIQLVCDSNLLFGIVGIGVSEFKPPLVADNIYQQFL